VRGNAEIVVTAKSTTSRANMLSRMTQDRDLDPDLTVPALDSVAAGKLPIDDGFPSDTSRAAARTVALGTFGSPPRRAVGRLVSECDAALPSY
jgi:hypothetical protein